MPCKTKCVSLAIFIISIIYIGERSPPGIPQVGFREGGMYVDLTPYLCVWGVKRLFPTLGSKGMSSILLFVVLTISQFQQP